MTTKPFVKPEVYWPLVRLTIGIWSDELRMCGGNISHIQIEAHGPRPHTRIVPHVNDFNRSFKRMADISDRLAKLTPPPEAVSFHRRFIRAQRRLIDVLNQFVEIWNAAQYSRASEVAVDFEAVSKPYIKLCREADRHVDRSSVDLNGPLDLSA